MNKQANHALRHYYTKFRQHQAAMNVIAELEDLRNMAREAGVWEGLKEDAA